MIAPSHGANWIRVGLVIVPLVVAGATWPAASWPWGFPAFYVGLGFILEFAVRLSSPLAESVVQNAILGLSLPWVFNGFFGHDWPATNSAVHLAAVACLALILGYALGARARRRGSMTS